MYSKHALTALLLASSAFLGSAASLRNNDRTNNGRRKKLDDNSECTILVAEYLEIPGETAAPDSTMDCGMDNGMIYRIQATDSQKEVLKQKWAKKEIASGATRLNVGVGAYADENALFIPPGLDIAKNLRKGPKKNRRKLAPLTGDKPILVVKVTDSGGLARSESAAQIGDDIFGTINDPVNLKSQLFDCSHGQMNVIPGTIPNASTNQAAPGVIEVSIPISLTNKSNTEIHNAVTAAVNAKLGTNLGNGWESITEPYHHVMYVIEKCYVDCGWAAYAYVNAWMSVYQDVFYKQVGVQVHELGHNFGFAHSGGLNGATYTDHTGMMGNPLYSDDTGKMCYNAAKNWQIGWYDDAKILINPLVEQSKTVNLVGIADYDVRNGKPVVVKIETGGAAGDDYFVGFNRAIRANAQNDEADNEVTIVQVEDGNGESYSQSWLRAHLVQGESYTIPNFAGTEYALTIIATKIDLASNPGFATVRFDYESGPTSAPTTAPCYSGTASVSITQDSYPVETTWDIKDGAGNICASGIDANGASNIALANGYYTFTIYDSYSDGICCGFGNGSYSLQVGNTVVKTGGEFGSQESTQFEICGNVSSPTAAPTQAPTSPPTNPPSPAPTSSPTTAPTKSPTPNPTSAPSSAPSSAPTASPTKSPTPNPTLPPTLAPTKAPTSAPTSSPPTKSPTPNPTVPPTNPPSPVPTSSPTSSPTAAPTQSPSPNPTTAPSPAPTPAVTTSPPSGGCDIVRVEILTDNYPGETSWQLTDTTSAEVLSGGGYTASSTTFSSEVCVDDWTSLSFTINDTYGDGICCAYGSGSYTVTVNGSTVLSGGAFGSSETKPLQATPCDNGEEIVGGEVVCKCASDEIRITVDLTTDNYPRETTWTLSTCDNVEVDAGSYTDRLTQHTDSICVPKNVAYRFQINDSYGDGICCSYGLGNYQISVDGIQAVSAVGDFSFSEVQDLNGVCSTNIVVSDPPLKCSSATRKQDCQGNCEWVGNGNKNGRCTLKPKEEPTPKCAACRSTGTSCCGSCVNNGPKWMRGCY